MSEPTKTDAIIHRLKNNKIISILIVLGVVLIAIGTLTDSMSKIKDFFATENNQKETKKYIIGISVENETNQEKRIRNFLEFFITEDDGLMLRTHPRGRLYLRKIGAEGLEEDYIIPPNEKIYYQVELPRTNYYLVLLERGAANIHFVIISAESSKEFYIETIPFHKEMFSSKWYVPIKMKIEHDKGAKEHEE